MLTHYLNLKYYLQLGLKVVAVHKDLKFRQAPWLQKCIIFNTHKEKEAKSAFEKDFLKIMNNSVSRKTRENLRKRRNILLCNNEKRAKQLVGSPTLQSFKTYEEGLTAVERLKTSIFMNRTVYVRFAILKPTKLFMYKFHYDYIKKNLKKTGNTTFNTDS